MSSPFRPSASSKSTPRSSPAGRPQNSLSRSGRNDYRVPHRHSLNDGSSHHLLQELSRQLIDDDRAFKKKLDENSLEQQKLQVDALDRALAKHEEVRQSAERVREMVEIELQRERVKRREEELRANEEARKKLVEEKAVAERLAEEGRRREEERKQQEAQRRQQEEARRLAEQENLKQEAEESARQRAAQEKEAAERKAQQDAVAHAKQREAASSSQIGAQPNGISSTSTPSAQPTIAAAKGLVSDRQEREKVHVRYLELHRRLKGMRQDVLKACKSQGNLKNMVGDWRRQIKKCCGQLNKVDKEANRRVVKEVLQILDQAMQIPEPSINVSQYILNGSPSDSGPSQGPGVLLYLLNIFSKQVIAQLIGESSVDPAMADPVGVLTATIFSNPKFLFNGQSLVDIFWAKYHRVCPIIFGISGSEKTAAGRARLGWATEKGDPPEPISSDEHYIRMAGLGAGFAAVTLRDFSKSKNQNPVPNQMYWEAVARLINTPPAEQQISHWVVLKALLHETFIPRFIVFFGSAAVAALRTAMVAFPKSALVTADHAAMRPYVSGVANMPAILQREMHLTL